MVYAIYRVKAYKDISPIFEADGIENEFYVEITDDYEFWGFGVDLDKVDHSFVISCIEGCGLEKCEYEIVSIDKYN